MRRNGVTARHRMLLFLASLAIGITLWAGGAADGGTGLDRNALKKGMALPEVVEAFGQPDRMEWLNVKGQPVLFLFYPSQDQIALLHPLGKDVLTLEDGRVYIPLGFVTERLAGWGKKFYEQSKFPE
jgi:hypothetical protein